MITYPITRSYFFVVREFTQPQQTKRDLIQSHRTADDGAVVVKITLISISHFCQLLMPTSYPALLMPKQTLMMKPRP